MAAMDKTHDAVECKRINASAQFHTKSWSYRFECPTCGKVRRYNTNFLGSRYRLVCDGKRVVREKTMIVGSLNPVEQTWVRTATPMKEG